MNQSGRQLMFDGPGRYRIRVQAELSASCVQASERPGGHRRATGTGQPPVTTLTGEVRDQAALMGVLNTLYDMGCPLLEVKRLGDVSPAGDPNSVRSDNSVTLSLAACWPTR